MTAILIWSAIPGGMAVLLYGLRRWPRAVYLAGIFTALLLAWLAWRYPIAQSIPVRLWPGLPSARIEPAQVLFNSRFVLANPARPALILLYLSLAFWFGGSEAARTHRLFIPLGLAAAALFTAALAAETIPAAVLLIALAGLICLPLLSAPGEPARRGAVRFLVYLTAGVCLVLFADASLSATLASQVEALHNELAPTMLMLALGFAFILAVVPFHTWLPMLAEDANPYAAAFVFYLLLVAVSFLALDVLARYSVSGLAPAMFSVLRYAGVLMTLTGGVGAAFERHLGRVLGFGAITAMGMTVLAISLNDQLGRPTAIVGIYFAQLLPQGMGLGVWSLALSVLRASAPGLDFRSVAGMARRRPLATGALLLANLSLAAMPLLAGFPPSLALWSALAEVSLPLALLALLSCGGLAAGALRSLAVLVWEEEAPAGQPAEAAAAPVREPAPAPAAAVPAAASAAPSAGASARPEAAPAAAPRPVTAAGRLDRLRLSLAGLRSWRPGVAFTPAQPAADWPGNGDGSGDGRGGWRTGGARWQIGETRAQAVLFILAMAALVIAGCLPQIYMPTLMNMGILFAGGTP